MEKIVIQSDILLVPATEARVPSPSEGLVTTQELQQAVESILSLPAPLTQEIIETFANLDDFDASFFDVESTPVEGTASTQL